MPSSPITTQPSLPESRAVELLDGTGLVGWIDENRVEFTGFADPAEAAAAAWVAHVGLERRSAQSRREPAPYLESPQLYLAASGGHEWIQSAGKRLARLVRPFSPAAERWFGFEIALPEDASELTIGSSAHVMYLALRRSGLSWSIRSRALAPEPLPTVIRAEEPRIALGDGRTRVAATRALEVEHALIR